MAARKRPDLVSLFPKHRVDLDAHNEGRQTPLHHAASGTNATIVNALLDAGAQIEARDRQGCTPLHIAVSEDNVFVAMALIDRGASLSGRGHQRRRPLARAVELGFPEICLVFVAAGCRSTRHHLRQGSDLHDHDVNRILAATGFTLPSS